MVGREQLPTAADGAAGSGRRERDRELGQLGGRPRRATRGRDRGRGLQRVGDPGRRPARAERKMPGALLGVVDQLRQAAMQRSPPARVELRLDARRQQGVAEADALVVQLHDRRCLGRAKPPGTVAASDATASTIETVGSLEQRNRLEHLANLLGQRRQARRDQPGERRGNGQPLTRARAPARLLERAPELERVERIPARRVVKLDQRRPRKRDAEPLAQQTMRRADAQRAEPQPPQPLARKRALEPERSRLRAAAAARDENRDRRCRQPSKREREHGRRRRIQPLHVVDRNQQRPARALLSSWNTANAIARSSGAAPSTSSSSNAAAKRPTLRHRQPRSPSGNTGRKRSASAANENAASAPAGRHEKTAKPCSRAAASAASNSVVLPIPASPSSTSAAGVSRPAARKSASTATSASRPTTGPRPVPHLPPRDARRKPRRPSDQDRRASALLDAKAPIGSSQSPR